jgi:hypothetical protein
MAQKRTAKQRAQLKEVQTALKTKAGQYAFRMSPHIARWEAKGLSEREIVSLLNEAGAVVPSEYTGEPYAPVPNKQWTQVQYQRLRAKAADAKERMAFWAKAHGKAHVRPYGDGAGLFSDPIAAGLEFDPNKARPKPLGKMSQAAAMKAGHSFPEWYKAYIAEQEANLRVIRAEQEAKEKAAAEEKERMKDPAYRAQRLKERDERFIKIAPGSLWLELMSEEEYRRWYELTPMKSTARTWEEHAKQLSQWRQILDEERKERMNDND